MNQSSNSLRLSVIQNVSGSIQKSVTASELVTRSRGLKRESGSRLEAAGCADITLIATKNNLARAFTTRRRSLNQHLRAAVYSDLINMSQLPHPRKQLNKVRMKIHLITRRDEPVSTVPIIDLCFVKVSITSSKLSARAIPCKANITYRIQNVKRLDRFYCAQ